VASTMSPTSTPPPSSSSSRVVPRESRSPNGAAVDGPGSLLNYQGHPVDRLTPGRDVTNPGPDAAVAFPESPRRQTACAATASWRDCVIDDLARSLALASIARLRTVTRQYQ
jgi:hypothetical protein